MTLLISFSAQANSMIEVGAGGAALGAGNPIDAVFKVEGQVGGEGHVVNERFVVASVDAAFTVGPDGVRYIDYRFESFGFESGVPEELMGAITFLNIDIQRNVVINNDLTYRITLVGLKGELGGAVGEGVKMYVKGAMDLLGIAYTKRASDGESMVGVGSGFEGEIGMSIDDTFRVAVGQKVGWVAGKPESRHYIQCDLVCDEWGCYDYCYNETDTFYNDHRVTSSTSLDLSYSLGANLGLFGQAAYNVYMVSDDTGETRDSVDAAWQFFFGMSGRW